MAAAVEDMRVLVRADGGDFLLEGWDEGDGVLRLRLALETAECAECVMPQPVLEEVALGIARRHLASVARVAIDDPRA